MTGISLSFLPKQSGEEGDQESSCLAGARLRLSGDILAGQGDRESFLLNRGAVGKSCGSDPFAKGFRELKIGKFHHVYTLFQ